MAITALPAGLYRTCMLVCLCAHSHFWAAGPLLESRWNESALGSM